jgi:5-methylthioadenosine/S-adenosylhomocysteine deaminase
VSNRLVISNARVLAIGQPWPEAAHIVVRDGSIESLLPATDQVPLADHVLDAAGGVVMPGFVNGHAHNNELLMRGRFFGLPLEPYILYNSPRSPSRAGLAPEDIYQRTLAACAEMLRNGVTSVADDVAHPSLAEEDIEAVLRGYRDGGIRARVSISVQDLPWSHSLPYQGPLGDDPLLTTALNDPDEAMQTYARVSASWAEPGSRVGLMVSPSAPQRCSRQLMRRLVDFARDTGLPFHVHIQETLSQYVVGPALFQGRSMVRYMHENDFLGPETTIAHAIWVSDDDIARIAASGASVVHNPVSNLKLGSGIAPVRRLLDAGVNLALGTDGLTCNDALDMFETTKTAAVLSCIGSPEPATWLTPAEVLTMATIGGARASRLSDVGALVPGAKADLVILDPISPAFVPRNDATAQAVFSARSRDVQHVVIDGRIVLRDGLCTTIDVASTHAHVIAAAERFWAEAEPTITENLRLLPGVQAAYQSCVDSLTGDVYRLLPGHRE